MCVCVCVVCFYLLDSHWLPCLHVECLVDLARGPLAQQASSAPSELNLLQSGQSHCVSGTCPLLTCTANNTVVLQLVVTFL